MPCRASRHSALASGSRLEDGMPGAIEISVRGEYKKLQKSLDTLAYQQLPFATSLALTAMAKRVQAAEVKAMRETFDNPTPFTLKSIGVQAARKGNLQATVYVKDKAAQYLEPYEDGGSHFLPAKVLLNPKDINLNSYGNLPRNTVKRLKARKDVFIGTVKTKSGQSISGVWQRPARGAQRQGGRGMKGKVNKIAGQRTGLKLLIRFGDALPVKQRLHYHSRAAKIVQASFNLEMGLSMTRALRTAK